MGPIIEVLLFQYASEGTNNIDSFGVLKENELKVCNFDCFCATKNVFLNFVC